MLTSIPAVSASGLRSLSFAAAARVTKLPKRRAGVRTVVIPGVILPALRQHMSPFAEQGRDGRVFLGAKGVTPRRKHFNRVWRKACADAGIKGLHFQISATRGTPWRQRPGQAPRG